eukprot:CAMPEP_0204393988 /NCGR_PEP_ID=MMETSP0469-20131031/62612_1 /ASSEMBLY_ACC=CAM_ASM_000384 /TAXON_ID=2969 /ORGANISM="Oxyrrhis marina" /LENGTH=1047 /DNA_ID=CAMNT_0051388095 /DNA_START=45 /DNA_END=3188 /DNA_ORIENTATION=+
MRGLFCFLAVVLAREVERRSLSGNLEADDPNRLRDIELFLREELQGKPFTYIVNPGNAGDSLIQYGTLLTLDAMGFKYDIADPKQSFTQSTLVYAGGGNAVGLYPDCREFLHKNAPMRKDNKIILLPATIKDEDRMLEVLDDNVKIIAREPRSYEYVKKFLPARNVFLADDLALKIPEYDSEVSRMRGSKPSEKKVAYMFRTDIEKTQKHLPEGNVDLSAKLDGVSWSGIAHSDVDLKMRVRKTVREIFSIMTDYTEVWTDRLHMCIAASLMDRETHCFPNNYWKNEAIFEFSLKHRFPHTDFSLKPPSMLLSASEEVGRKSLTGNLEADDPNRLRDIELFLREELQGKPFTYIVNPGNAGDALIQYGTLLTLDAMGFKYDIADFTQSFTNSTLVYAGAGNAVGLYGNCRGFLRKNAPMRKHNKIILLPATIKDEDRMLRALHSNVKIIAREPRSYEYVKKFLPARNVFLADDLALKIPEYDSEVSRMRGSKPSEKKVAYMFRTDKEKTHKHLPKGNVDLSAKLDGVSWRGIAHSDADLKMRLRNTAREIFSIMIDYTEVWTDRLHMCIAASLMDRETHCFPNNYWKNEAIFDFSLKHRFPHTHFSLKPPSMLLSASEEVVSPRSLRRAHSASAVEQLQMNQTEAVSMLMVHIAPDASPVTVSHHEAVAFIAGAVLAVVVPRIVEMYVQNQFTFYMVFLMDVAVWYLTTSVYMAASAQLFVADSSMTRRIVVTILQVCAGGALLLFGGAGKIVYGETRLIILLLAAGCAYFFASLYVLEGLTRASAVFVCNIRALEPLSTALFVMLAGGTVLRAWQMVGLVVAILGVMLSTLDPSSAHSVAGSAPQSHVHVALNLVIVMLANVMNSVRNIVMAQTAGLVEGVPKATLFACTCVCAFPFGVISLVIASTTALEPQPSVLSMRFDPALLAISSTCFVLYNLCSFFVLVRVQPVVHSVLLTGKRVVTVILACVLLKQFPNGLGAAGVLVNVVGLAIFEADKQKGSSGPAVQDSKPTRMSKILSSEAGLPMAVVCFAALSMASLLHIRLPA